MTIQINGTTVVDNSRNITGTTVTGTSELSFGGGATPTRPGSPVAGDIRYNTSVGKIEVYTGSAWRYLDNATLSYTSIGLFAGGNAPGAPSTVPYNIYSLDLNSGGTAQFFGEMSSNKANPASCSSTTRTVVSGGTGTSNGSFLNVMEYVTTSNISNTTLFGYLNNSRSNHFGTSNATLGLFGGGLASPSGAATQDVQKITIATTGNSTPFSSLVTTNYDVGAMSTPTTAYITGGTNEVTIMRYTSYPSGGTWSFFGTLNAPGGRQRHTSAGNIDRGLNMSGLQLPATLTSTIDYMTFSSLGSTTPYGTLTTARSYSASTSSPTYAYIGGGNNNSTTYYTSIERVFLTTYSNGSSFGNLVSGTANITSSSNVHGGLGFPSPFSPTTISGQIGLFSSGTVNGSTIARNVDYMILTSTANTVNYAETSISLNNGACLASSTRAVFGTGRTHSGAYLSNMEYSTITSAGRTIFFGNLNNGRTNLFGTSNATIGLFGGGLASPSGAATQDVQKITIATTGNSSSFSSLPTSNYDNGAMSTPTRIVITGGANEVTIMRYTSYPSGGTWSFFGSLNNPAGRQRHKSANNSTRGLNMSGLQLPSTLTNTIDYITIASTGNSSPYGTLTTARSYSASTSSPTYAYIGGGNNNSTTYYTSIERVSLSSLGNGSPYASLSNVNSNFYATSNVHGGL